MLEVVSHTPVGSLPKIAKPTLASVVPRRRLFRRLDQARRRPVVWISSPAGSGKSTLVASYIDDRKLRCLWYQVDASDDDPASFFYYLGMAAKKVTSSRRALPLLTPTYVADTLAFSRAFFREFYGRFRGPAVLVLDNFQDASSDGPLPAALRDALAEIPAGLTVVIASRSDPPAFLSHLNAQERMAMLSWDDLRLTANETRAVAKLKSGSGRLASGTAETLHRQTDGWLAGLILLLQQRGSSPANEEPLPDGYRRSVFTYLGGEVLREADPATRDVLLKTALLQRVTAELAQTVTNDAQAGKVLSTWAGRGFLVSRHPGSPPTYQLHPLFREFLLDKAHEILDRDALEDARQQAVQALMDDGRWEDAVELLLEMEDWARLTEAVRSAAPALIAQGRHRTLEAWLRGLRDDRLHGSAWLSYWLGMACMPFAPVQAREDLVRALELFRSEGEVANAMLACAAVIDTYMVAWSFKEIREWTATCESLMAEAEGLPSQVERRALTAMLGALSYVHPTYQRIPVWVERVARLFDETNDASERLRIASVLALRFHWRGELESAREILEKARPAARLDVADPTSFAMFHANQAIQHWTRGHCDEACSAVAAALEQIGSRGGHEWDRQVVLQGAYACLQAGDTQGASTYVGRVTPLGSAGNPLARSHDLFLRAGLELALGNPERAVAQSCAAIEAACTVGVPLAEALSRLRLAGALCDLEHFEEAREQLDQVLEIGDAMGSYVLTADCLLGLSEVAAATGDPERARDLLSQGVSRASRSSYPFPLSWRRDALAGRCAEALHHGIEPDFVPSVIRVRRLKPPQGLAHSDAWPWQVVVCALGPLCIDRDGVVKQAGRKGQRKPLELLSALIANGGRGVSQVKLGDMIWPDADGDRQARSLRSNVHRLRALLGDKESLVAEGGLLSLDPSRVFVDALAVERLLHQDDAESCSQVVELYRGPFLADRDEPWLLPMRERLRDGYVHAVERVAAASAEAGEVERVVELYERAVECEPSVEALHRGLTEAYAATGRAPEAQAAHDRWVRMVPDGSGAV